ncbi:LptF/LptG family permease [bacterium]|nr:LptF/LptG family permease [bacterium]
MKIIDRYIISEHIAPFFLAFAILMFVMLMDLVIDVLDMIIEKGIQAGTVFQLFFLNTSWMVALAVPMATLVASVMAFGRLSGDTEIVAMKSNGIPLWRMVYPAIVVGGILTVAMIFFGDLVLPKANYKAKLLTRQLAHKRPTLSIKSNVVVKDFPGFLLKVEEVDHKRAEVKNITIYDNRDRLYPRTITAKRGKFSLTPGGNTLTLTLTNGEIHEVDERSTERYTRIEFEHQIFRLRAPNNETSPLSIKRGDRELSISEMLLRIESFSSMNEQAHASLDSVIDEAFGELFHPKRRGVGRTTRRRLFAKNAEYLARIHKEVNRIQTYEYNIRKLLVEIHKKYSLPFACFFFILIGAPIGVWVRRGGLSTGVAASIGFFVIYWAFLIGGEELADRGIISPVVAMWTANLLLLILGVIFIFNRREWKPLGKPNL